MYEADYLNDFLTIREVTEKWKITPRRVQKKCVDVRIDGARKFRRDWAIPADAERPKDARVTTRAYRNWRKKDSETNNKQ